MWKHQAVQPVQFWSQGPHRQAQAQRPETAWLENARPFKKKNGRGPIKWTKCWDIYNICLCLCICIPIYIYLSLSLSLSLWILDINCNIYSMYQYIYTGLYKRDTYLMYLFPRVWPCIYIYISIYIIYIYNVECTCTYFPNIFTSKKTHVAACCPG